MNNIRKELIKFYTVDEFYNYFKSWQKDFKDQFYKNQFKKEFDRSDFIIDCINLIANQSHNLRILTYNLDLTKDIKEYIKGISDKQLYLNYNIIADLIKDYYFILDQQEKIYIDFK